MKKVAVIGGGPAGQTVAKELAQAGCAVEVFDYPHPRQGKKWPFGGTCVNVGCIPKKLLHLVSRRIKSVKAFGDVRGEASSIEATVNWNKYIETTTNYIRGLSHSYKNGLKDAGVAIRTNEVGRVLGTGPFRVLERETARELGAFDFVVRCEGARPFVPDVPGAELAVTSDEIFWRRSAPGRVLCVGASYVSLEIAGALRGLGCDVTVAVRSILLRGFDRECAEVIGTQLEEDGVAFRKTLPTALAEEAGEAPGLDPELPTIKVTFADGTTDYFNTVLYATGRVPTKTSLNLYDECDGCKVDVEVSIAGGQTNGNAPGGAPPTGPDTATPTTEEHDKNGFLKVVDMKKGDLRTMRAGIYACGDIVSGAPQLTPWAMSMGNIVALQIKEAIEGKTLDRDALRPAYEPDCVPTAVFTPVEYACVGVTEEEAPAGAEVWRTRFETVVDTCFPTRPAPSNFVKVITVEGRVVGIHYISENAADVIQALAVAFRKGLTKDDLDRTLAIHPTESEALTMLSITKSSGEDFVAKGGCGGGKCG